LLCVFFTFADPDNFSIGSIVTFQSDGTPLLQLHVQVKVDNVLICISTTYRPSNH